MQNRKKDTVGVALGSGGAKGISHFAVMDELDAYSIPISFISGSSIGAVVGASYCCGTLARLKKRIMSLSWKKMLMLVDPVISKSGLIDGEKIIEFFSEFIPGDAIFENLSIPLAIIATDYHSGKPVVFNKGNILNAVRASISIPGIFTPYKFKNTLLIDGGVASPLPIDILKKMGAKKTIAVNLHPSLGRMKFKKEIINTMNEIDFIEIDSELLDDKKIKKSITTDEKWFDDMFSFTKTKKEKIPSLFDIITQSLDIMENMSTRLMLKYIKPDVLIEPDVHDIGALDFSQAAKAYSLGIMAYNEKKAKINKL